MTSQALKTKHWALLEPLYGAHVLPWVAQLHLRMHACARVCVCVCLHVRVLAHVCAHARMCFSDCGAVLASPVKQNAHRWSNHNCSPNVNTHVCPHQNQMSAHMFAPTKILAGPAERFHPDADNALLTPAEQLYLLVRL